MASFRLSLNEGQIVGYLNQKKKEQNKNINLHKKENQTKKTKRKRKVKIYEDLRAAEVKAWLLYNNLLILTP